MRDSFTSREEREIRSSLRRGETPACPRCGGLLQETPIQASREVSYVRVRVLFQCTRCGLKGVVDRK